MTCDKTHFRFESSIGCIPVAGRSAACTGSSAAPAAGAPAPPAGPDSQGTAALRTHGTARTSARSARPVTFPTFDHQPLVHMFKLTLKEPKKPLSDLGWVGEHKNTNPGAQGHLLHAYQLQFHIFGQKTGGLTHRHNCEASTFFERAFVTL